LRRPTPLVDHGGRLATASSLGEGLRTLAGMLDVEAAALNAEIDRLRDLIGPSQESYDQLKATLDAAETAARSAQQAAGEVRGELIEGQVALVRAQQTQVALASTSLGVTVRAARRARRSVGRARRAITAHLP
jgi:hypothetical protein